jgi:hypothetical protein
LSGSGIDLLKELKMIKDTIQKASNKALFLKQYINIKCVSVTYSQRHLYSREVINVAGISDTMADGNCSFDIVISKTVLN